MKRFGEGSEMARLEPLVGEWALSGADDPEQAAVGTMRCEWFGDKAFLIQRTSVSVHGAPDALIVIGPGDAPGTFVQHYFDARGVERQFSMTLTEEEWRLQRLWRESPSFMDQRFIGRFTDGGDTIEARWERANDDDEDWQLDFEFVYRRKR